MSKKSKFNNEVLKDKIQILLEDDDEVKKWNEGVSIKSLILLPIIIFLIGFFFLNRPEKITDILVFFLYPLGLVSIGLIILFVMRNRG